jgi:uncharacterized glyoxalase superfamily protein PhnB
MKKTLIISLDSCSGSIQFETQEQAKTMFNKIVQHFDLIAFDPDPWGYRYAHNEDLTICVWIESTVNC